MRIPNRVPLAWLAVLAAILLVPASRAHAQQNPQQNPGAMHPAYLHVLSDLRLARACMDQIHDPSLRPDVHHVIDEIDHAIHEIRVASIDDGKDLNDHPPIDAALPPSGRWHKTLDLLHAAHVDLSHAEDLPQAVGLKGRAQRHIDQAAETVSNVILSKSW